MFHNGTDEVVGQAVANSAGTTWSVGLRTDFVGVRLVYVLVDGTVLDSSPFFLEVKVPACPAGQVPDAGGVCACPLGSALVGGSCTVASRAANVGAIAGSLGGGAFALALCTFAVAQRRTRRAELARFKAWKAREFAVRAAMARIAAAKHELELVHILLDIAELLFPRVLGAAAATFADGGTDALHMKRVRTLTEPGRKALSAALSDKHPECSADEEVAADSSETSVWWSTVHSAGAEAADSRQFVGGLASFADWRAASAALGSQHAVTLPLSAGDAGVAGFLQLHLPPPAQGVASWIASAACAGGSADEADAPLWVAGEEHQREAARAGRLPLIQEACCAVGSAVFARRIAFGMDAPSTEEEAQEGDELLGSLRSRSTRGSTRSSVLFVRDASHGRSTDAASRAAGGAQPREAAQSGLVPIGEDAAPCGAHETTETSSLRGTPGHEGAVAKAEGSLAPLPQPSEGRLLALEAGMEAATLRMMAWDLDPWGLSDPELVDLCIRMWLPCGLLPRGRGLARALGLPLPALARLVDGVRVRACRTTRSTAGATSSWSPSPPGASWPPAPSCGPAWGRPAWRRCCWRRCATTWSTRAPPTRTKWPPPARSHWCTPTAACWSATTPTAPRCCWRKPAC